jgi:hypothetical protein
MQTLVRREVELKGAHIHGESLGGLRPAILMPRCPDAGRPPTEGECTYCPIRSCPGKAGAWGNWHRHFKYQGLARPEWFKINEDRPAEGEAP